MQEIKKTAAHVTQQELEEEKGAGRKSGRHISLCWL